MIKTPIKTKRIDSFWYTKRIEKHCFLSWKQDEFIREARKQQKPFNPAPFVTAPKKPS